MPSTPVGDFHSLVNEHAERTRKREAKKIRLALTFQDHPPLEKEKVEPDSSGLRIGHQAEDQELGLSERAAVGSGARHPPPTWLGRSERRKVVEHAGNRE